MDKMQEYAEKIASLGKALEDDASDLWKITNAIKKEIEAREWIMEGRGCYAWDDERYKNETRLAFEAVLELIKSVQHPAQLRFHKVLSDYDGAKANLKEIFEKATLYDALLEQTRGKCSICIILADLDIVLSACGGAHD